MFVQVWIGGLRPLCYYISNRYVAWLAAKVLLHALYSSAVLIPVARQPVRSVHQNRCIKPEPAFNFWTLLIAFTRSKPLFNCATIVLYRNQPEESMAVTSHGSFRDDYCLTAYFIFSRRLVSMLLENSLPDASAWNKTLKMQTRRIF